MGGIKSDIRAITAGLDKLNGLVAHHEQALVEHVSGCPLQYLLDEVRKAISTHTAEYVGINSAKKSWGGRLTPAVWMLQTGNHTPTPQWPRLSDVHPRQVEIRTSITVCSTASDFPCQRAFFV